MNTQIDNPEIRSEQRCIIVGKGKYHRRTQEEFEHLVKVEEERISRSIEWHRKKDIRDANKPEDKFPWLPKNLTQKEINDWAVRNVDILIWADRNFKDPCQEEQILRELVILNRDHRNVLKIDYRASLKKYRPDINKKERNKIIKEIEHRNPGFFMV